MEENIVGKRIKEQRERLGLSLREAADKIGMSVGYLSTIERGEGLPSVEKIRTISKGLGRPLIWFIGEEDVMDKINILDNTKGTDLYDFILNKYVFPNGLTYCEMDKRLKTLEEKVSKTDELEGVINKLREVIIPSDDSK